MRSFNSLPNIDVSDHHFVALRHVISINHRDFMIAPFSSTIMFDSEDIQSSLNLKSQGTDYETANYPPEHDCNSLPLSLSITSLTHSQPLLQEALVLQRTPGLNQPSEESISPLISPESPKILLLPQPPSTPPTLSLPSTPSVFP